MTPVEVPTGAVRVTGGRVEGAVAAPASKSVTNRLLVMAALARGRSVLVRPLDSDDTRAMAGLVAGLGATVSMEGERWVVEGTGGAPRPVAGELDARLSGTTMRFGIALSALSEVPVTVTGLPPLLRRPVGPLSAALRALGADVSDRDGHPPVSVSGPLRGGSVTVDVRGSSQYATALLLVAPCATDRDVTLELHGQAAYAYIDLTVAGMRRWGIAGIAQPEDRTWVVPHGGGYEAREEAVEYDASAAAHLLTLAAATGGVLEISNADPATGQPDAAFAELLDLMAPEPGVLVGVGGYDLGHMPDQLPNAAVLAALAEGESVFTGAAVVRGHETDRIAALVTELRKLGVDASERPDGLRVVGGVPAGGGRAGGLATGTGEVRLATYDDHRLAMAFAALAAGAADRVAVVVEEPECVTKTYPGFWSDARALGLAWEPAP